MNRPSRNEIEQSLSDSIRETPIRVERSSLDLPTKDSHRQSRVIGGNLDGVSRQVPKRNYTGWIIAACLVLFSGLIFVIPEFTNKTPKITQNKPTTPASDLYNQNIEKSAENTSNGNSENSFTLPDDRNRAADYRQTELLQKKLLELKIKAEASIVKGDFTKPINDNALIYYQEMLALDSNNIAATDGINYMLNRLLTVGNEMLIANDVTTAKKALESLATIDIESIEYFDLTEAISAYEVKQKQQVINQKITALFKQADQATNKNNLVKPDKRNATFFYQEILKLDQKNSKARQGLETIRQNYADLAEQQINDRQWDKAEAAIENLKLASEDSVLTTFLNKRLDEAKSKPELTSEENIAENNSNSDQNETTVFAPFPNNSEVISNQNNINPESQTSPIQSDRNNSPAPTTDLSVSTNDTTIAQRERDALRAVAPVSDALNPAPPAQNNSQNIPAQDNPNSTAVANPPNVRAAADTNQDQNQLTNGLQAYYNGEYITAFSNLAPLADKNITRAQIRIGYMYQFGRGVAQDQALGSQYLRTALPDLIKRAQQSQSWAQSDLGSLYEDGIIVTQSYDEALNWYRKAAAQNYAGAQTNLGNMYFFGKGVEQSQDEAIKWYRLAAIGGDAIAKQNLIQLEAVSF